MKATNGISFILATLFLFTFMYIANRSSREQSAHIEELERKIDSIELEIFTKDAIIGRYEMGLVQLAEQHPKEAQKYIKIILKETE